MDRLNISVLLFQIVMLFEQYEGRSKSEFIVFNERRESTYGMRIGDEIMIAQKADSNRNVESYLIGENVKLIDQMSPSNIFKFKNESILFVDSLGVYKLENLESPIVVLQYSPKINLERLIKELQPSQIIADASNYRSLVQLWEETCIETKTPFWNTNQNGAYILN